MRSETDTVVVDDILGVEEAETLLGWLLEHPNGQIDLSACTHLHCANLQVLMALRPRIQSWPDDPVLAAWLKTTIS